MPFFREVNPSAGVRAGIWHITETADELQALVHLTEAELTHLGSFRNDTRKKHWLACRALLRHLLAPYPAIISYDENNKPFLPSGSHHISLSHAGEYAAAVYSKTSPVGIDIEQLKDRVERVKDRFMQGSELDSIVAEKRIEHLYIHWCGKEALYKLYGKPELDFRNDIYIHPFNYLCNTNKACQATLILNGLPEEFRLFYDKMEGYMLVVAYYTAS